MQIMMHLFVLVVLTCFTLPEVVSVENPLLEAFPEYRELVQKVSALNGNTAALQSSLNVKTAALQAKDQQTDAAIANINQKLTDLKAAFTSRLGSSQNLNGGEVVKFDNVDTNEQSMYDSSTGHATAPADGMYVFFYSCMAKPGHLSHLGLVVNGALVDRCWGDSRNSTGFQIDSRMQTVYLTKGSTVYVKQVTVANSYIHGFHTTFSGFKL